MLNYLFITMGPGSSPDPNIYYRTYKRNVVIDRRGHTGMGSGQASVNGDFFLLP